MSREFRVPNTFHKWSFHSLLSLEAKPLVGVKTGREGGCSLGSAYLLEIILLVVRAVGSAYLVDLWVDNTELEDSFLGAVRIHIDKRS